MNKYKIYGSKYNLSKQLGGEEIPSKIKMFHVEIIKNKNRVAFLSRKTYDEAKKSAEEYLKE